MLPFPRCLTCDAHAPGALGADFCEYGRPGKTKQTGLIALS